MQEETKDSSKEKKPKETKPAAKQAIAVESNLSEEL